MVKIEVFDDFVCIRKVTLFFSVWAMAALTGCASMQASVPLSDLDSFTAKTETQRALSHVRVRWDVREDASRVCGIKVASLGSQNGAVAPIACAIWNTATKECVIVTGRQVAHANLGRELRQCFEGRVY